MELCVRGVGTGLGLMAVSVVTPGTTHVVAWTLDRDDARTHLTRSTGAEPW